MIGRDLILNGGDVLKDRSRYFFSFFVLLTEMTMQGEFKISSFCFSEFSIWP